MMPPGGEGAEGPARVWAPSPRRNLTPAGTGFGGGGSAETSRARADPPTRSLAQTSPPGGEGTSETGPRESAKGEDDAIASAT